MQAPRGYLALCVHAVPTTVAHGDAIKARKRNSARPEEEDALGILQELPGYRGHCISPGSHHWSSAACGYP